MRLQLPRPAVDPAGEADVKFLVLWQLELSRVSTDLVRLVARMPEHARPLEESGKVIGRYHIVGAHGGAWIYDVASNEELEMLAGQLACSTTSPVTRCSPLADMSALPIQPPPGTA